jgi:quinol monooxygenase YgiN
MTDGVMVTVLWHLKPEMVEGFCAALPAMLQDTAKFPGFRNIRVVRQAANPNRVLFVERWDSEAAYHSYLAWRTKRGDLDGVEAMMAAPLELDFWPVLVACA